MDTAENTNTDLKFRRVIESIKTNTNYNTLTGLQLPFFRINLRKLGFPSPWRMEKRHKGINNPKFQEELSLENEHANDDLFGHSTLESRKPALLIIYKNNKILPPRSYNLYAET